MTFIAGGCSNIIIPFCFHLYLLLLPSYSSSFSSSSPPPPPLLISLLPLLFLSLSFSPPPLPSPPTPQPSDEVLETLEDGLLMDPPDGCPDDIYDIMCCCWDMEPSERPSFPSLQQMLSKSFGELHTGTDMHNLEGSPSVSSVLVHACKQPMEVSRDISERHTECLCNSMQPGPNASLYTCNLFREPRGYSHECVTIKLIIFKAHLNLTSWASPA